VTARDQYRTSFFRDFYDQFKTAKHVLFCSEKQHCSTFVNEARRFKSRGSFAAIEASEIGDEFECGQVVFSNVHDPDTKYDQASVCVPEDLCGDDYRIGNVLISAHCGYSKHILLS